MSEQDDAGQGNSLPLIAVTRGDDSGVNAVHGCKPLLLGSVEAGCYAMSCRPVVVCGGADAAFLMGEAARKLRCRTTDCLAWPPLPQASLSCPFRRTAALPPVPVRADEVRHAQHDRPSRPWRHSCRSGGGNRWCRYPWLSITSMVRPVPGYPVCRPSVEVEPSTARLL
jgi:hypothetical protein